MTTPVPPCTLLLCHYRPPHPTLTPAPTPATALTLKVVKKNSPGLSCRKRTPASATGASRNSTSSCVRKGGFETGRRGRGERAHGGLRPAARQRAAARPACTCSPRPGRRPPRQRGPGSGCLRPRSPLLPHARGAHLAVAEAAEHRHQRREARDQHALPQLLEMVPDGHLMGGGGGRRGAARRGPVWCGVGSAGAGRRAARRAAPRGECTLPPSGRPPPRRWGAPCRHAAAARARLSPAHLEVVGQLLLLRKEELLHRRRLLGAARRQRLKVHFQVERRAARPATARNRGAVVVAGRCGEGGAGGGRAGRRRGAWRRRRRTAQRRGAARAARRAARARRGRTCRLLALGRGAWPQRSRPRLLQARPRSAAGQALEPAWPHRCLRARAC
jgi:hypothetical protein